MKPIFPTKQDGKYILTEQDVENINEAFDKLIGDLNQLQSTPTPEDENKKLRDALDVISSFPIDKNPISIINYAKAVLKELK